MEGWNSGAYARPQHGQCLRDLTRKGWETVSNHHRKPSLHLANWYSKNNNDIILLEYNKINIAYVNHPCKWGSDNIPGKNNILICHKKVIHIYWKRHEKHWKFSEHPSRRPQSKKEDPHVTDVRGHCSTTARLVYTLIHLTFHHPTPSRMSLRFSSPDRQNATDNNTVWIAVLWSAGVQSFQGGSLRAQASEILQQVKVTQSGQGTPRCFPSLFPSSPLLCNPNAYSGTKG